MAAVKPLHQTEEQFKAAVGLADFIQMISGFKGGVRVDGVPGPVFKELTS